MKCNLIDRENLISKYLLNELSEDECLNFEEHYFKCEECFNELKAAEEALTLIKKEGSAILYKAQKVKKESAKSFIDKMLSGFVNPAKAGIAFAAIVTIFVLFYLFYNSNGNENTKPILAKDTRDSVKQLVEEKNLQNEEGTTLKQDNTKLIASVTGPAFEPNPYYEEWINDNVRAGNILFDKAIIPKNNDKYFNQDILFKWLMKENISVNLVIMNNEDELIFSTKVTSESFPEYSYSLNKKELKKSGLYYWRIEDEIEVLYLGKFYFIRK